MQFMGLFLTQTYKVVIVQSMVKANVATSTRSGSPRLPKSREFRPLRNGLIRRLIC